MLKSTATSVQLFHVIYSCHGLVLLVNMQTGVFNSLIYLKVCSALVVHTSTGEQHEL